MLYTLAPRPMLKAATAQRPRTTPLARRPVCSSAEQAAVGRRVAMGLGVSLAASLLTGPRDAASAKDKGGVYWVSPADGATVQSPVKVKMGVKGLDVVPAAQGPVEGSGHHHILVDQPVNYLAPGEKIPFEDGFVHYGKAQTEAELELPPGKHKLTLQFAKYDHSSYGKAYAKTINVTVK